MKMRIVGCLFMMCMMFIYPDKTAEAARRALHIFGLDIIPTLFPYMVLTRALVCRIKSPSVFIAAGFALLGGSPSGASIISIYASRHGMRRRTLYAICTLTGTISPVFLLNTASVWLGDLRIARLLTVSHFSGALISSLIVYVLMIRNDEALTYSMPAPSTQDDSAIAASVIPVLGIGGCLVFFSVLSEFLSIALFQSGSIAASFTHAMIEISGGIRELCEYLHHRKSTVCTLIAFASGFSGFSILSQNAMFLRKLNITMPKLIGMGLLRGSVCTLVMRILLLVYSI